MVFYTNKHALRKKKQQLFSLYVWLMNNSRQQKQIVPKCSNGLTENENFIPQIALPEVHVYF